MKHSTCGPQPMLRPQGMLAVSFYTDVKPFVRCGLRCAGHRPLTADLCESLNDSRKNCFRLLEVEFWTKMSNEQRKSRRLDTMANPRAEGDTIRLWSRGMPRPSTCELGTCQCIDSSGQVSARVFCLIADLCMTIR